MYYLISMETQAMEAMMYELLNAPETPGYIPPQAPEVCVPTFFVNGYANGYTNGYFNAYNRCYCNCYCQHIVNIICFDATRVIVCGCLKL
jgi:hypothetical protein